jgi:hypothetical protein
MRYIHRHHDALLKDPWSLSVNNNMGSRAMPRVDFIALSENGERYMDTTFVPFVEVLMLQPR